MRAVGDMCIEEELQVATTTTWAKCRGCGWELDKKMRRDDGDVWEFDKKNEAGLWRGRGGVLFYHLEAF